MVSQGDFDAQRSHFFPGTTGGNGMALQSTERQIVADVAQESNGSMMGGGFHQRQFGSHSAGAADPFSQPNSNLMMPHQTQG